MLCGLTINKKHLPQKTRKCLELNGIHLRALAFNDGDARLA